MSLVVVALDRDVARWCAEPIDLGRQRSIIRPWVLGPETMPVIADLARARAQPELAVLSVATHADEPGVEQLAYAAVQAARALDDERAMIYAEFIMARLSEASRAAFRDLLYRDDWAPEYREYRKLGRASERRGKAALLLKQFELKGFELSEAQRQRVLDCEDEAQFELWAARVLVATRLDQVLTD